MKEREREGERGKDISYQKVEVGSSPALFKQVEDGEGEQRVFGGLESGQSELQRSFQRLDLT